MNIKIIRAQALLSLVTACFLMSPNSARAQDVDQNVKILETRVQQLEQRVAQLEALIFQTQKNSGSRRAPSSGNWRDKTKWRSLQKGMTKQQVRQILGEPPKVSADSFVGDTWLYPDHLGGKVNFSPTDQVRSWDEP